MITPKHRALAWLANQFVGVVETKTNGGAMVEKFQRAVDGVASGEPWCVCFVQHCANEVDALFDLLQLAVAVPKHGLPKTEWTVGLWSATPAHLQRQLPEPGCIVVWRSLTDPNKGHCGIVTAVNAQSVITVEGNTSSGFGDQREGDGVWSKERHNGLLIGFQRLGYISPWP